MQKVGLAYSRWAPQHQSGFDGIAAGESGECGHGFAVGPGEKIGERWRLRGRQFEDQLLHFAFRYRRGKKAKSRIPREGGAARPAMLPTPAARAERRRSRTIVRTQAARR